MPPPSPTRDGRKEQFVTWKQQREASKTKSPTAKTEPRQRRRSMEAVPMERQETMAATYTKQYLQRRRSQADTTRNEQQRRSSGCERMERRRSSTDAGAVSDPLNGKEPFPQPQLDEKLLENGHKENGYHHSVDTTVATDPIEDVVAAAGKGIGTENDGRFATIDRDQSVKVTMTMTKKRKAPCGRSTMALAVLAGVVTVTVAGGIAVCRVYPSSPAAISIRFAASKMEEFLFILLSELQNEVRPYSKHLVELMRMKWLALLKNGRLEKAACAADVLLKEDLRGSSGLTAVATVYLEGIPRHAVSSLLGALKLSLEWIQSHVHTVFTLIEQELGGDSELFDQVQSFLMAALSSLVEALTQGAEWTRSSLNHVLEWTGLKSDVNDVSLSSDEFLAPLETNQAAIQSIGRGLTTHESQALQDVKRFEKRRLTIAFDTNAILAETRDFALESVVSVKMAALEAIERRLKQLEEQYARSFDQALKEYERTSRQVEKEGGAGVLAEIAVENQAHVDAAAALPRALTSDEKILDENPAELPVSEDHEPPNDGFATDQSDIAAQEDRLPEELPESAMLTKKDAPEEGNREEIQIVTELVKEGLMAIDLAEAPAEERSSPEEALESEHVVEEQAEIPADFAEKDQLTADLSVGDHVSEDQDFVIAKLAEENLVTAELESTDKVVAGKTEEVFVTEVVVGLGDAVLEMERTQVELTELLESHNLSEVDSSTREMEDRLKAHFSVPADGTNLELDVEVDKQEVERAFSVRTRIATQPGIEEDDSLEEQKKHTTELTEAEKHAQVQEEISIADDTQIYVQGEEMNAEIVFKVEKDADEADAVAKELQRGEESELVSVRNHDQAAAEKETQERDVGTVDEAQQQTGDVQLKQDVHTAISNEIETLETVVAKEIQELEQLEQVLLQTEGERVRVEEELRAIAKEEEIWLLTEQASAEGEAYQQDSVPDQRSTATIDRTADTKSEGIPAPTLPGSALTQIGLLSVAFLVLAALTAYLLIRYRKHGLLSRPPRRKRWRRLADMNESDTEEVVLMPDDSSDEEEDTDQAASKEVHDEVIELTSSVEVTATTIEASDDEEAANEEKTAATHKIVQEHEELVENESDSKTSRTVVVGRAQTSTYTVDHPATSSSDASADDSSAANVSMSTPPAPKKETPDTSQRTRRRRRQVRM
ncbi:hypothetical protein JG688_00002088 [Phytophthora aleatoria]|uniref:Transmembrane protein n=1 Tax=Phytophthora aleatoria TaxID=2496075 RepID=A0A8J5JFN5_9STRA|nr:hypothetical protein JG688_00002088 [Phytophthora aleatoria]